MQDRHTCSATHPLHHELVAGVRQQMPPEATLGELANFFKVLGDSTRCRIISALDLSELCVCDLAALLGMNKSAISHQLRTLRQARLVKYRREGKIVYYALDDDHIKQIFETALTHLSEHRAATAGKEQQKNEEA